MSRLESTQKALEKLGLSSKQAEIYVLLVGHGDLRIQEIATQAHIPRSSVYQNLQRLHALGIVEEIIVDTHKRIRACPISIMRHSFEEAIASLQQQTQELAAIEKDMAALASGTPHPTDVRYYKGRAGARQVYWNTLKAENTVYVYSEWGRQQYVGLKFYESFAAENHKRGLREHVLINTSSSTLDSIQAHTLPEAIGTRSRIKDIRVVDAASVQIKGDTMIYNHIYAQVYLRSTEIHGFEIENKDFIATQRSIFETLWETAKPVTDLLNTSS